jgi:XTP/dITP diphosphohydrolase
MQIVFATNNSGKLSEAQKILSNTIQILSLKDIGAEADIPETADTIEENALIKARYVFENFQLDCFSDDTGLEVEALNGRPGVYSARYAGKDSNAGANMDKLLLELEGNNNRKAQFKTVIALIYKGEEYLFEGIIKGIIAEEKKGSQGFGYDPIFIPEGYSKTFAELSSEIKNNISHRAIALEKMRSFLRHCQR